MTNGALIEKLVTMVDEGASGEEILDEFAGEYIQFRKRKDGFASLAERDAALFDDYISGKYSISELERKYHLSNKSIYRKINQR